MNKRIKSSSSRTPQSPAQHTQPHCTRCKPLLSRLKLALSQLRGLKGLNEHSLIKENTELRQSLKIAFEQKQVLMQTISKLQNKQFSKLKKEFLRLKFNEVNGSLRLRSLSIKNTKSISQIAVLEADNQLKAHQLQTLKKDFDLIHQKQFNQQLHAEKKKLLQADQLNLRLQASIGELVKDCQERDLKIVALQAKVDELNYAIKNLSKGPKQILMSFIEPKQELPSRKVLINSRRDTVRILYQPIKLSSIKEIQYQLVVNLFQSKIPYRDIDSAVAQLFEGLDSEVDLTLGELICRLGRTPFCLKEEEKAKNLGRYLLELNGIPIKSLDQTGNNLATVKSILKKFIIRYQLYDNQMQKALENTFRQVSETFMLREVPLEQFIRAADALNLNSPPLYTFLIVRNSKVNQLYSDNLLL